ncbi:hypothetical protein T439DRAFT_150125 [Meredithblackwellia eburnea MCA 4105]
MSTDSLDSNLGGVALSDHLPARERERERGGAVRHHPLLQLVADPFDPTSQLRTSSHLRVLNGPTSGTIPIQDSPGVAHKSLQSLITRDLSKTTGIDSPGTPSLDPPPGSRHARRASCGEPFALKTEFMGLPFTDLDALLKLLRSHSQDALTGWHSLTVAQVFSSLKNDLYTENKNFQELVRRFRDVPIAYLKQVAEEEVGTRCAVFNDAWLNKWDEAEKKIIRCMSNGGKIARKSGVLHRGDTCETSRSHPIRQLQIRGVLRNHE